MVVKASQERVSTLLKDTITLLCKNGLEFQRKFTVEALIGVTLDDNEVFLISMNELIKSDNVSPEAEGQAPDTTSGSTRKHRSPEHRRKRKRPELEIDVALDPKIMVKSEPVAPEPPEEEPPGPERRFNPKTEELWGEEGPPSLSFSAVDDSSSQSYPANTDEPAAKTMRHENADDDDNEDDDDDGDDLVFVKQEGSETPRSSCAMSRSFPGRSPSSQQYSPGAFTSQPNFGDMSLQPLSSHESGAIWSQTSPGMSPPFSSPVRGGRAGISTVTSGSLDPSQQQPGQRMHTDDSENQENQYSQSQKSYKCELCEIAYAVPNRLKRHVKLIHKQKYLLFCEACQQEFGEKKYLARHLKAQSTQLRCQYCTETFITRCDLEIHNQVHIKVKEELQVKEELF